MSQGSSHAQFSRKITLRTYSSSGQVMVRSLSKSKRTSWSAQTSVSEEVKCDQLDHSFHKAAGSVQNLKVLTFIETSTSMCGAVTIPDLSANQVRVKALKQLIMVNGFTHSVLQCNGHSGLMKLQDQVGKDLSVPTQISPPYSHQSHGTVERFHKTLYGQVRARCSSGIHPDSTAARLMPWIIAHAVFTINRYLIRQDGKKSYERVFNNAHSGPLAHFGERVLAHHQATPPPKSFI